MITQQMIFNDFCKKELGVVVDAINTLVGGDLKDLIQRHTPIESVAKRFNLNHEVYRVQAPSYFIADLIIALIDQDYFTYEDLKKALDV